MRYRLLAAFVALGIAASPAAEAQAAKARIAAAQKAFKAKNYKKALAEFQAACAAEPSAECQLGVADSYAKLGDKAKAKQAYENIVNDPFAQESFVSKAKNAIAKLGSASAPPELPGLDLPAVPAVASGDPGLPSLDLPPPPSDAKKSKKGKKTEVAAATPPPLDLPPLDLPAAPPVEKKTKKKDKEKVASAPPPGLDLPALDLPAMPAATAKADKKTKKGKKEKEAVAANTPPELPPMDLPVTPPPSDAPPELPAATPSDAPAVVATATPEAPPAVTPPVVEKKQPEKVAKKDTKKDKTVAAVTKQPAASSGNEPLVSTPPSTRAKVPQEAIASTTRDTTPGPAVSGGKVRTLAWVTTGIAVAALGGGAFAYTKATAAQSDVRSGFRSGAENQKLLDQQKLNRSLSAAGLLGGVVAGGVAAMLFTF